MTTATTTPTPARATQPRPLWLRVAGTLTSAHLVVAAWYAATAAVVCVGLLAAVQRWLTPEMSAVALAQQVAVWFPFAVSIVLAASYLRTFVAAGATRRSFWLAGLASALVNALVYAAVFTALLLVERAAYDRLGWSALDLNTGEEVLAVGLAAQLWGMALLVATMTLAGLLVGATYLRWRGWATFLLPLTALLPFLLVTVTTEAPQAGIIISSDPLPQVLLLQVQSTPLGVVLGLLALALTAAAAWLALRDVPIRPTSG